MSSKSMDLEESDVLETDPHCISNLFRESMSLLHGPEENEDSLYNPTLSMPNSDLSSENLNVSGDTVLNGSADQTMGSESYANDIRNFAVEEWIQDIIHSPDKEVPMPAFGYDTVHRMAASPFNQVTGSPGYNPPNSPMPELHVAEVYGTVASPVNRMRSPGDNPPNTPMSNNGVGYHFGKNIPPYNPPSYHDVIRAAINKPPALPARRALRYDAPDNFPFVPYQPVPQFGWWYPPQHTPVRLPPIERSFLSGADPLPLANHYPIIHLPKKRQYALRTNSAKEKSAFKRVKKAKPVKKAKDVPAPTESVEVPARNADFDADVAQMLLFGDLEAAVNGQKEAATL